MPTAYRMVILAAISAALAMLLAVMPVAAQSLAVADVRVGDHADKTRLVLDVTGPAQYRYALADNGEALFIELPGAQWRSAAFAARHSRGLITEFSHSTDATGVHINVLTDGPVAVRPPFLLPPGEGKGYRVVFDIVRATNAVAAAPAARAPAPSRYVEVASADPSYSPPPPRADGAQMAEMRGTAPARTPQEVAQAQQPPPGQTGMAGSQGYYLRGGIGFNFMPTADTSGTGNNASWEFENGWEFAGAAGLDLENGFRAEAELRYTSNDLESVAGTANATAYNSATVDGSASSLSGMANLAYDFHNVTSITPYVFGGLGLAWLSINDVSVVGAKIANDTDLVFAMQAGVGLSYALDEHTFIEGYYRYFETTDPDFSDTAGRPFEAEFTTHTVGAGLRVKF